MSRKHGNMSRKYKDMSRKHNTCPENIKAYPENIKTCPENIKTCPESIKTWSEKMKTFQFEVPVSYYEHCKKRCWLHVIQKWPWISNIVEKALCIIWNISYPQNWKETPTIIKNRNVLYLGVEFL